MAFTTFVPAFVNDSMTIPASYLNQIRIDMGRALDGNAGGLYTPSSILEIDGSGIRSDTATFDGTTTISGTATITAATTFSSNVTFTNASSTQQAGPLILATTLGRLRMRIDVATLGDGSDDLTIENDVWLVTGALTANRTYTIRHTGNVAAEGDRVRLARKNGSANTILIQREDTTALATMDANFQTWVDFVFTSSVWHVDGFSANVSSIHVA